MYFFRLLSILLIIILFGERTVSQSTTKNRINIENIYSPFDSLKTNVSDYFLPVDKNLPLTSAFADFRSTHFHAGIDFSTFGKLGYPVYASNSGYISEVSVSPYGYGKLICIRHPDGFTTMYAHLQKFNEKIEAFVRRQQYKNGVYPFEAYPKPNMFPVKRGEIIAYTGNTGVGDAHLHFEIRDAEMNPIDPLLFPEFAKHFHDQLPPRFQQIAFSPLTANSTIYGDYRKWIAKIQQIGSNEYRVPEIVYLKGTIGISIKASDYIGSTKYANRANLYMCYLDGKKIFSSNIFRVPSKYFKQIALHYDWTLWRENNAYFQKMYIEPGNRLPFYERMDEGSGIIKTDNLESGLHNLRIVASDYYGNSSTLSVIISLLNSSSMKEALFSKPDGITSNSLDEPPIIADESDTGMISFSESMPHYFADEINGKSNTSLIINKEFNRNYMAVVVTSQLPLTLRPTMWITSSARRELIDIFPLATNQYFGTFQFAIKDSGKIRIDATADINGTHDVNAYDEFNLYSITPERGGLITSSDRKFSIKFAPEAVYQTIYCRIENTINGYAILPDDVLLNKGAQVSLHLNNELSSSRTGLFYSNGSGWSLLDWTAPNQKSKLTGNVTRFLGEFTILADTLPPDISSLQLQHRKGILTLSFKINDALAGVNSRSMHLWIDNKIIIAAYDPYSSTVHFNEPIKLKSGTHTLTISVKDHMENAITVEKPFFVR